MTTTQPGQEQKMEIDPEAATLNQIMRANAAVAPNLDDNDQPKHGSAFGYACAITAIMQTDAARPTADLGDDGELVERVVAALEARRDIYAEKEGRVAEHDTRPLEQRLNYTREDLFEHAREAMEFAIEEVRAVLSRR